jgi:hypothetical protein
MDSASANIESSNGKKRKENPCKDKHGDSKWNFDVEYNDHFETPAHAYADLMPVFRSLAEELHKSVEDIVIYDPYYCNGRVVTILQNLGFRNVINRNRDFYADIASESIPGFYITLSLINF